MAMGADCPSCARTASAHMRNTSFSYTANTCHDGRRCCVAGYLTLMEKGIGVIGVTRRLLINILYFQ